MKKAKKENAARQSRLLARLMSSMEGSMLRDAVYTRGMVARIRPELKALIDQDLMANGAIVVTVKPSDVERENRNNNIGMAMRDFIYHGKHMETFEVTADGTVARKDWAWPIRIPGPPDKADIAAVVAMHGCLTYLFNQIQCVVVPGRCLLEMDMGFAPYVLIGTRADYESEVTYTRISMQAPRKAAQTWMFEIYTQFRQYVF